MKEFPYDLIEFRYIDKATKQRFCVFAREQKTADEIISIVNEKNIYYFIKPKFRKFKFKVVSSKPPYEVEQEQFEIAEKQKQKRLEYFKTHKGVLDNG